ncbi:MAG: ribosome silencing factor [Cyanobacteria bacterium REEB65]|nr:ribosome silencing factor [Cyanobacteria bacterium REEB65]
MSKGGSKGLDSSWELSNLAAQAADEKKAQAIMLLDLQAVSLLADFFVLCNGTTPIQVRAIAQNVQDSLEAAGFRLSRSEGMQEGRWVLLDFGVVIVHVMHEREREFYNLERLWNQARLVPYQAAASA